MEEPAKDTQMIEFTWSQLDYMFLPLGRISTQIETNFSQRLKKFKIYIFVHQDALIPKEEIFLRNRGQPYQIFMKMDTCIWLDGN